MDSSYPAGTMPARQGQGFAGHMLTFGQALVELAAMGDVEDFAAQGLHSVGVRPNDPIIRISRAHLCHLCWGDSIAESPIQSVEPNFGGFCA